MKVLILNGCHSDSDHDLVHERIVNQLVCQGHEVQSIMLRDMNIKHCIGCFSCWVNTPGECIFKDDASKIVELFINSDLVIYFTPIVFGGYSSLLKNILDRLLPLYIPSMNKLQGETHNKKRYEKYPDLMVFGIQENLDEEEAEIFKDLVARNGMNMWHPQFEVSVIKVGEVDDLLNEVDSIIIEMEVLK